MTLEAAYDFRSSFFLLLSVSFFLLLLSVICAALRNDTLFPAL